MDIEKILSKLALYNDTIIMDEDDKKRFYKFVRNLKSSRKVRFIYRGESHLNEHYNSDLSNISILCQCIFVVGEKGRMFLKEHCKTTANIFEILWDKINKKICNLNFSSESTKEKVSKFLIKNLNFYLYFSNDNNKNTFINNIHLPNNKRIMVIDYYLSFLHTIGKSGFDNSYFLSSSENISTAENFRNDGIIFYGWVAKKGIKDKIISYEDINKKNKFIESLGLPIYENSIYPEQKEICLKAGLLPHFIIGFQHNDKFYINPNILEQWTEDIIYTGLNIDQSKFNEIIGRTQYKRTVLFCDGNYYLIDGNHIDEF